MMRTAMIIKNAVVNCNEEHIVKKRFHARKHTSLFRKKHFASPSLLNKLINCIPKLEIIVKTVINLM